MKITIFPSEKNIFKAVSWYAKQTYGDSCVQLIGEQVNLFLDKSVIFDTFTVSVVSKGNPVTMSGYETNPKIYTELVLEGSDEKEMVEFIKTSIFEYEKKCRQFITIDKLVNILTWDGGGWSNEYNTPKRSNSSIYLPDNSYETILGDLKKFYSNEKRYSQLEIPYARTYMFHGLPGTGKTSMIYTLASELNKQIAILDFSDREMSDSSIRRAVYKIPDDTILCLEDMDALFSSDRKSDKSTITFSGVLNILDGVIRNKGLVIFMTTNLLSNMDDTAMKRRVDYYLKFDVMKKEQIKNMFRRFYPDQDSNVFWSFVSKLQLTPCILQKFFVRHLDSDDVVTHINELVDMCTHDYKIDNNNSSTMYT